MSSSIECQPNDSINVDQNRDDEISKPNLITDLVLINQQQQPIESIVEATTTTSPSNSFVDISGVNPQLDAAIASTSRANIDYHHHTSFTDEQANPPNDHLSDTSSGAGFTSFEPLNSASISAVVDATNITNLDEIEQLQPGSSSSGRQSSIVGQLSRQPGRYRRGKSQGNINLPSPTLATTSTSNNNIDYLLSLLPPVELSTTTNNPSSLLPYEDPIVIRGNGNITLFGLSNSFSTTFPSALLGRVSREEFEFTINRINQQLQQQHSTNAKFLLLGCLCCCCSLGCSLLWPTFALSKRTRNSLEKLLSMENSRLYNKLGLNLRLTKQQSHTNHSFMEYILVVDFLPKMHIYQPD